MFFITNIKSKAYRIYIYEKNSNSYIIRFIISKKLWNRLEFIQIVDL